MYKSNSLSLSKIVKRTQLTFFIKLVLTVSIILQGPATLLAISSPRTEKKKAIRDTISASEVFRDSLNEFEQATSGTVHSSFVLDTFYLLPQVVNRDQKIRAMDKKSLAVHKNINWWETILTVRKETAEPKNTKAAGSGKASPEWTRLASISMYDNADFSKNNPSVSCADAPCSLSLTFKGKVYNELFLDVESLTTFGQFIVFTLKDGFDADSETQRLFFLDLNRFTTHIGNEELPIFEVPIPAKTAITSLTTEKTNLMANGSALINAAQIDDLSKIMESYFIITANLSDANTVANSLPLLESLTQFMEHHDKKPHNTGDLIDKVYASLDTELREKLSAVQKTANSGALKQSIEDLKKTAPSQFTKKGNVLSDVVADLDKSESYKGALSRAKNEAVNRRNWKSQLALFKRSLLVPKPNSSSLIKKAIAGTVALTKKAMGLKDSVILDDIAKKQFVTAGMVTAAAWALVAPESFTQMTNMGLMAGQSLVASVWDTVAQWGQLIKSSSRETFSFLYSPVESIGGTYFADGRWAKTLVGVSALLGSIVTLMFVPHALMNSYKLAKDLKAWDYTADEYKGLNKIKKVIKSFIARQNKVERDYMMALIDGEKERLKEKLKLEADVKWTDSHEKEIDAYFVKMKYKEGHEKEPLTLRVKNGFRKIFGKEARAKSKAAATEGLSEDGIKKFNSFGAALKHLYFSYATYTYSIHQYSGFWNWWSGVRYSMAGWDYINLPLAMKLPYIKPKLATIATRVVMPKFFSTTVLKNSKKTVLPTDLNGGLKSIFGIVGGKFNRLVAKAFLGTLSKPLADEMATTALIEDEVIGLEEKVISTVFPKALQALTSYIKDDKELERLYQSINGVSSITSAPIQALNSRHKTFIRTYFDSVFKEVIDTSLREIYEDNRGDELGESILSQFRQMLPDRPDLVKSLEAALTDDSENISTATLDEIKKMAVLMRLKNKESFKIELGEERIKEIVDQANSKTVHLEKAKKAAELYSDLTKIKKDKNQDLEPTKIVNGIARNDGVFQKTGIFSKPSQLLIDAYNRLATNTKFGVAAGLDPTQNPSMFRFAQVNEMRKNPLALARAVRMELNEILVTLPVDIIFKLLFLAGISEGLNVPIHEEFLSEDATFYLGHYAFYGGLVTGIAASILASTWLKLQEDARHEGLNNFGDIPQGEDAKRGFFSWWFKQTFRHPDNTVWKNYKYHWSIAYGNMPAALLNVAILYQLVPLGRFDIDGLAAMYLLAIPPLGAFSQTLEQGYELAAYHPVRGIDEKLLTHPRVQKYLQYRSQTDRAKFNLLADLLYRNPVGYLQSNFAISPGPQGGSYGFIGAMTGGQNFTELAVEGLRKVNQTTSGIPVLGGVVESVTSACEAVLTNNNTHLNLGDK